MISCIQGIQDLFNVSQTQLFLCYIVASKQDTSPSNFRRIRFFKLKKTTLHKGQYVVLQKKVPLSASKHENLAPKHDLSEYTT